QALDNGQPASGIPIQWSVQTGSAILAASQTLTGADGRAQVDVTLGDQTGPVRIRATRSDESSAVVEFQLTVVNVEQLSIVSGDAQQAQAGTEGEPLVVRFVRNGAPAGGEAVSWSVLSGDASVDPATSTTDVQGLASTAISFGPEGGGVVVEASAGSAAPVRFVLSVTGGNTPPPGGIQLVLVSGSGQSGAPGSLADEQLVVEARNDAGEPQPGMPIGWRVLSGSANLGAQEVNTGEDGRAAIGFRFAQQPGPVTIRASAFSDLVFVDFEAEAYAPDVGIVSGDGQ